MSVYQYVYTIFSLNAQSNNKLCFYVSFYIPENEGKTKTTFILRRIKPLQKKVSYQNGILSSAKSTFFFFFKFLRFYFFYAATRKWKKNLYLNVFVRFIWYCILAVSLEKKSIGFVFHHTFCSHLHVMLTFNVGGVFIRIFFLSLTFFLIFMTKKTAFLWEKLLVLTLLVPTLLLVALHLRSQQQTLSCSVFLIFFLFW